MTEKGVEFEAINFFEQPMTADLLKQLLRAAGLKPSEALRTNDAIYKEKVAGKNLSDEELIRLMVKHPELIQRPIVVKGKKAVLARPSEKLAELGIQFFAITRSRSDRGICIA